MSVENIVPGGNTPTPGGPKETENSENNQQQNVVSYASHQKLLDEKKGLAKKLEDLESAAKQREEEVLKQNENWKQLAENRTAELAKIKSDFEGLNRQITDSKKFSAFFKEINGQVPEQYWNLVDVEKIPLDESGNPDPVGVKNLAREFETTYKEVIRPKGGNKMPNNAAQAPTPSDFESELKAAKSQKELDAVMIKYGKI
jgi:hypothetical protein